jgi:hypothetical protein
MSYGLSHMRFFATACLIAASSLAAAAPPPRPVGPMPELRTELVVLPPADTEAQCLDRAKAVLAAEFPATQLGSHTVRAGHDNLVVQIECLHGRGGSAAYVSVAFTGPDDAALRARLVKAIQATR